MLANAQESPNLISRRSFLGRTGGLALVGASYGLFVPARAEDGSILQPNWEDLHKRLNGRLLRPGDPGFYAAALPNNLEYESVLPAGIARCGSARDVAEAIAWSVANKFPRMARAGGHSYAGYSTTSGLLIDVSGMAAVHFDPVTKLATVGGGARNSDIYRALSPHGVAITHGRCPSVGVAGLVLGGGIGFNMRLHGLTCDRLVGSEIVTADGKLRAISANQDNDLFWACRGGAGGNFGINTSFTFRTFPVHDLTAFKIAWREKSVAQTEKVYTALLNTLHAAPLKMGSRVGLIAVTPQQLMAGQDAEVRLLAQLYDRPAAVRKIMAPVFAVSPPADAEIEPMRNYWDAQYGVLAEEGHAGRYRERSLFFKHADLVRAIPTALAWARKWPGTGASAQMALFQIDGHVHDTKAADTAFVHRDSTWLMTINLQWSDKDTTDTIRRNKQWQDEFHDAMSEFSNNKQAYQNFPDASLKDWARAYYGGNLADLKTVKQKYDPTNVFDYEQGIGRA